MYGVSEQFVSAIKNNARYIRAYFTFDGKEYFPRKIIMEDDIYTNDAFVGTFIAKNGTLTTNVKDNLNLEDKEISLFMGVKTGESFEYIPVGTFKIYERISENEYKIIDYRYKFNVKFDVDQVVFPTKPSKVLKSACEQAGVELNTVDYPNKDLEIPFEIFFGYEATCADIVMAVAQSSCCFAKITRENKLELKWFDHVDFDINYDHQKDKNENEFTQAVNTVVLAREPQNDNVYYPEVVGDVRTEFKIANNPILDIDRYVSILPIYNRMQGFNYLPFSLKTQGYFHLDAGDIIRRQRSDMSYENLLIMNHKIDFSGGVSSTFETPALTKTQIDYKIASVIENKILDTELQVDKVKGEIKAIAKETSGLNEKFANFVIDVNGIKQEVKETTEKVESLDTQKSDMYFYLSTSNEILVGGSWTAESPTWTKGKYIWQKTKYTYANGTTSESDPVCVTGNGGQDGNDAILLYIDSSNGSIFKNSSVATTLTVTVIVAGLRLDTSQKLKEHFGEGANIIWEFKRLGETEFNPIANNDPRLSDGGFIFTLHPNDVQTKHTFNCVLDY